MEANIGDSGHTKSKEQGEKTIREAQEALTPQRAGQGVYSQDELSDLRGRKPSWRGLKCQTEGLESTLEKEGNRHRKHFSLQLPPSHKMEEPMNSSRAMSQSQAPKAVKATLAQTN